MNSEQVTIDGINYVINIAMEAKVVGGTPVYDKYCGAFCNTITIPNKIEYRDKIYTVTKIGNAAFAGSMLTNIYIGSNVVSIEDFAFAGCKHLLEVRNGFSVKNIGNGAFSGCYSVTLIQCQNVLFIGDFAFYACYCFNQFNTDCGDNAKSILYNVSKIGNMAFHSVKFDRIEFYTPLTNINRSDFGGEYVKVKLIKESSRSLTVYRNH
jgi:hypothetical protein